jgi:dTDP-4-amino-4,6-dideoxygalactose transaminase
MIPFSPPYIDDDIIDSVSETLRSGWITTGKKAHDLESEIGKLCNASDVLCVNSATSGLMIALKWFGIGPGDEVIVPAYTYCATALAVHHLGATVVMADVNDEFNINPAELGALITESTKAIIPVDFAGYPCDYDKIFQLVASSEIISQFKPANKVQKDLGRILILSDAAHSIGANYYGKPSGSLADITVFSLHAVKNITTAEGGAICLTLPDSLSNKEVFQKMKLMSLNGQTKDAYSKKKSGDWRYDIVLDGYKMNMPDICAAIGLVQIRKYTELLLPLRKLVANQYDSAFRRLPWAVLPPLKNESKETSYHIYPLSIKGIDEIRRDMIIDRILQKGVAVNVHFMPLPMLSFFKDMGYCIDNYPITYKKFCCEISLPIYPQLNRSDIDLVINAVVESYNEVIKND